MMQAWADYLDGLRGSEIAVNNGEPLESSNDAVDEPSKLKRPRNVPGAQPRYTQRRRRTIADELQFRPTEDI